VGNHRLFLLIQKVVRFFVRASLPFSPYKQNTFGSEIKILNHGTARTGFILSPAEKTGTNFKELVA
jgi:hypothetical protein